MEKCSNNINLLVDIGNTSIKIAEIENNNIIFKHNILSDNFKEFYNYINKNSYNNIIISNVRNENPKFENNCKNVYIFDNSLLLPFANLYKSPETIGRDRLAVIAGAQFLYPKQNVLVIDSGTAITFDFINNLSQYIGGNISPGLKMRFKALNNYTGKLPLLSESENFDFLGNSTKSAIVSGVQNGMIMEINSYIEKVNLLYPNTITILTGGDANFFENKIKFKTIISVDLLFLGLNRILNYNVENKII